jgi:hypothetical protein
MIVSVVAVELVPDDELLGTLAGPGKAGTFVELPLVPELVGFSGARPEEVRVEKSPNNPSLSELLLISTCPPGKSATCIPDS